MSFPPESQPNPERGHEANGDISVARVVNEETALLSDGHRQSPDNEADPQDEQESWNNPAINVYRFSSVNLTLLIMGMNDMCLGVGDDALLG